MSVRVASQVAKRVTVGSWKLGNFKKVLRMLEFDGEYLAGHSKPNFDVFAKNSQKTSCKTFHTKTYFA